MSVSTLFDKEPLGKNLAEIHPKSDVRSQAVAIKPFLTCLAASTMCQAQLKYYLVNVLATAMLVPKKGGK
jgi:hypothetical protein